MAWHYQCMILRPAGPDDAASATHLIRDAYADWRDHLADLPDVSAGVDADIAAGLVVIAEQDSIPVGVLITQPVDRALHIRNIAVASETKGKGIGRVLMEHADDLAADAGLKLLRLATHRDMAPTRAFYARLGWEIESEVGNKVTMVRHLPSSGERQ